MNKNIFAPYIKNNEIHVDSDNWHLIQFYHSQEELIQHISDAIQLYDIKLPYREITIQDVNEEYHKLKKQDSLMSDGVWGSKFDYKYSYLPQYIGSSLVGNKASDYFHQVERWKCDATGYPSPRKTFDNERFRLTLFKALFSLKVKEINPKILRNIISLRKYIASQFRPSAAKTVYDYFKAETVLDFSMGWGDRILGAHTSNYVQKYVGFDPNKNLFKGYFDQIDHYEMINPTKKTFILNQSCAENEDFVTNDEFDLIFTSPPYFDKEKYSNDEHQSFIKHKGFDNWMKDFLYKTIELRTKSLKVGGHLVINISDIYTRKKHYPICDLMNDFIDNTNNFEYIGGIGFKMPKRPMSKSSKNVGIYGEPVWIWKKRK